MIKLLISEQRKKSLLSYENRSKLLNEDLWLYSPVYVCLCLCLYVSVSRGRGGGRLGSILDGMCKQFFEKTHFEGIHYVKIIPIMNGKCISFCTEGTVAVCLCLYEFPGVHESWAWMIS